MAFDLREVEGQLVLRSRCWVLVFSKETWALGQRKLLNVIDVVNYRIVKVPGDAPAQADAAMPAYPWGRSYPRTYA